MSLTEWRQKQLIVKKAVDIIYYFFLVWATLIIVFNLSGKIAFGHGLGDAFYLLILLLVTILTTILWVRLKKYNNSVFSLILLILLTVIVFMLKLTVYRGPEFH